ncbi:hypothetical protein GOBAR_AA12373 [Gossypium barbadense]|uniref:DUF4283 domain-containing protein n=1 Tax=Gossypium barbadense TaxID=3634 RepID=A0A2P5XY54_GOSBA|nr:hypothetical protein GOBAR_AA12373 [Gossypium barbadense]
MTKYANSIELTSAQSWMASYGGIENSEANLVEKLIPKKVRFRDKDDNTHNGMMIDLSLDQSISWRDKLVGQSFKTDFKESNEKEDLVILEWDIQKSFVNGMPAIYFSDRIYQILIQGMDNIVVLKLLGRNIRFSVLQNKIHSLWKPLAPIHMMYIENGYFLVKFQNKLDCEKALSEGPWTIFGQYLTVQPWTLDFDPSQPFPNVVMA